ncbi:hypothetical protein FISHEDRAFT_78896 [Fistulina hepatica ATCC 64428]|uniref:Uncharacterized protein n=1 Tax=Fistulina hepatica ATCC 64428 TaxID=1128425 RepID=A0A0D6ZZ08_9AGAR|nr:hypothetical protein FISHEDRAFT_78896 [Fistulina hepatica ATCC 64428]
MSLPIERLKLRNARLSSKSKAFQKQVKVLSKSKPAVKARAKAKKQTKSTEFVSDSKEEGDMPTGSKRKATPSTSELPVKKIIVEEKGEKEKDSDSEGTKSSSGEDSVA